MEIRGAAGVIPVRRRPDGWQVYLVQRGSKGRFFPGFHAFPGGGMEACDEEDPRLCAVRELWEETLLWPGQPPAVRDRGRLPDSPELHRLRPAGIRTTPDYVLIRFRAHFFLWECPPDQEPEVIPGELLHGRWWDLQEAVEAWTRAEIFCAAPTSDSLQALLRASTWDEAEARLCAIPEHTPDPIPVYPGLAYIPLETPTLPPARHTLCFLLGEESLVVVDPGSADPGQLQRLDRVIGDRTVEAVLFTHHHPDHVGGLSWAQERGIPLWMHRSTADPLGVRPDRELRDGDFVGEWQALHTPGHASGHLALWHPQRRVLLPGDLVSGISTILIASPDGDMADYLQSLRRCIDLQPRLLLPSHGGPFGPGNRLLENTLAHRLERERKVAAALGGTFDEILETAYADAGGPARQLARLSLQSHLRKLVKDGVARQFEDRWLPA